MTCDSKIEPRSQVMCCVYMHSTGGRWAAGALPTRTGPASQPALSSVSLLTPCASRLCVSYLTSGVVLVSEMLQSLN